MTGRWAAVLRVQITHLCAHQDWRSLAPATARTAVRGCGLWVPELGHQS
jgi:hypothetical protein